MVRPCSFGPNEETAATNSFQHTLEAATASAVSDVQSRAVAEFDGAVATLESAGVQVVVLSDRPSPRTPDAVFPNNTFSTEHDGTLVFYPMLALNRRLELQPELLTSSLRAAGFSITRTMDWTPWALEGVFLEGTGSVVLSHRDRKAFAVLSPRTSALALERFGAALGYTVVSFSAVDVAGAAVYHTNVVLSVSDAVAVFCAESVPSEAERGSVRAALAAPGRVVIEITFEQMCAFAGNVLVVSSADGARSVLVLSETAASAFDAAQMAELKRAVDSVAVLRIPTIESYGGGSARCMVAEVFLPRSSERGH